MLPSSIRSQADWWAYAEAACKQLPEYAAEMCRGWDESKAAEALAGKDYVTLHVMCERLWADLPDSPGIHWGPFGTLCDLCSEYWVFEGDPPFDWPEPS